MVFLSNLSLTEMIVPVDVVCVINCFTFRFNVFGFMFNWCSIDGIRTAIRSSFTYCCRHHHCCCYRLLLLSGIVCFFFIYLNLQQESTIQRAPLKRVMKIYWKIFIKFDKKKLRWWLYLMLYYNIFPSTNRLLFIEIVFLSNRILLLSS